MAQFVALCFIQVSKALWKVATPDLETDKHLLKAAGCLHSVNPTPWTSTDLYGRALWNLSEDHDAAVLIGSHLLPLLIHLDQRQSWRSQRQNELKKKKKTIKSKPVDECSSECLNNTMPHSSKNKLQLVSHPISYIKSCSLHWAIK